MPETGSDEHEPSLDIPDGSTSAPVITSTLTPRMISWRSRGLNWLRSARETEIARLKSRQEHDWEEESADIRMITWVLALRHEEARIRGERSERQGTALVVFGIGVGTMAIGLVTYGWYTLLLGVSSGGILHVPENLWEFAIVNGATSLLILGAATGLFRVAHQYNLRGLEHQREMAETRNIETIIRLCLGQRSTSNEKVQKAFVDLALAMQKKSEPKQGDSEPNLSALPDHVKELSETLIKLVQAKTSK